VVFDLFLRGFDFGDAYVDERQLASLSHRGAMADAAIKDAGGDSGWR